MSEETYDYIIIGAGSSGCVVANRLSADPKTRVLLLEAGPEDRNRWIHVPAGMMRLFTDTDINWAYSTEPEPELGGRRVYWPRGKTLGGSSAINGMAYVRGQPQDYDQWASLGNDGWRWSDVLPLFRRSEAYWGGADALHGDGRDPHGSAGHVEVTSSQGRMARGSAIDRATEAFIAGAAETGLPVNTDFNGPVQEGAGWVDHTITGRGRRDSTATGYLRPARNRPNLTVKAGALVDRLVLEGARAVAVDYERGGARRRAKAAGEIILCAGAVNSPQLLMRSGVGPARQLAGLGIAVEHDNPNVGANLQDHMYVHWVHEVRPGFSFNHEISGPRLLPNILAFYLRGRGLLTTGASSGYIFCRSREGIDTPDIQVGFRAFSSEPMVSGTAGTHRFPGWSASVTNLRPKSRGRIELASADPRDAPRIFANYLSHPADLDVMMNALRRVERIYAAPTMRDVLVRRLAPAGEIADDADLEAYIRSRGDTMFHPVGTCRMGTGDDAVVDPQLRVRGIAGLRVADASIMPTIISGNTNAPCIMIGEKAADLILDRRSAA